MAFFTAQYLEFKAIVILIFLNFLVRIECVCPNGCLCDDENLIVICENGNLDFVPITLNPLVEKLYLKGNRIRTIESSFSFYNELTLIDISFNQLLKISRGSFNNQLKLVQLKLNNNKLTAINNFTFGGISINKGNKQQNAAQFHLDELLLLDLHANLLEMLDDEIFSFTPNLEELDLSENLLKSIGNLHGLKKLIILKLARNELVTIPNAFGNTSETNFNEEKVANLSNLINLHMGMNPIEQIPANAFSKLSSLKILDLRSCRIRSINSNSLNGLHNLQKLILTDNNLMEVPSLTAYSGKYLEVLKLGQNPIKIIRRNDFEHFEFLKILELNGLIDLETIEHSSFDSNLNLERIEITGSQQLHNIPSKLFAKNVNLKHLILKENALKSIPEDLISWSSLDSLNLEGTQLDCTCELIWLSRVLNFKQFQNTSFLVLCENPLEFSKKTLLESLNKDYSAFHCAYYEDALSSTSNPVLMLTVIVLVMIVLVTFFTLLYRHHNLISQKLCSSTSFSTTRNINESFHIKGNHPIPPSKLFVHKTEGSFLSPNSTCTSTSNSTTSSSGTVPYRLEESIYAYTTDEDLNILTKAIPSSSQVIFRHDPSSLCLHTSSHLQPNGLINRNFGHNSTSNAYDRRFHTLFHENITKSCQEHPRNSQSWNCTFSPCSAIHSHSEYECPKDFNFPHLNSNSHYLTSKASNSLNFDETKHVSNSPYRIPITEL